MPKSFQRFTLNVELQNIDPPIWRRIEVEGTESRRKLHHILQAAFGWEDTHLHDFLIDGMTYAMFEVEFGVRMVRAEERIRAVAADAQAAALLKVPAGSPLLSVERLAFTYNDTPMELRRGLYRTDTHHYRNELN